MSYYDIFQSTPIPPDFNGEMQDVALGCNGKHHAKHTCLVDVEDGKVVHASASRTNTVGDCDGVTCADKKKGWFSHDQEEATP